MKINLDNKYMITSDEKQFILSKVYRAEKGENAGKLVNTAISFHGSLEGILNSYLNKLILQSEATTLQQLLEEIKDIREYIKKVVEQ